MPKTISTLALENTLNRAPKTISNGETQCISTHAPRTIHSHGLIKNTRVPESLSKQVLGNTSNCSTKTNPTNAHKRKSVVTSKHAPLPSKNRKVNQTEVTKRLATESAAALLTNDHDYLGAIPSTSGNVQYVQKPTLKHKTNIQWLTSNGSLQKVHYVSIPQASPPSPPPQIQPVEQFFPTSTPKPKLQPSKLSNLGGCGISKNNYYKKNTKITNTTTSN